MQSPPFHRWLTSLTICFKNCSTIKLWYNIVLIIIPGAILRSAFVSKGAILLPAISYPKRCFPPQKLPFLKINFTYLFMLCYMVLNCGNLSKQHEIIQWMYSTVRTTKKNVFSQKFLFITEKYSNWQGVGQNVARDIARGVAGKVDVHKLIGHWFNQILYFDPEAVKSFGYVHYLFIYLFIYLLYAYVNLKH